MSSRIRSIPLLHRCDALGRRRLAAVHEATLRVLAKVGIGLRSARLRRELTARGAIDRGDGRVRLGAEMVEAALASAPSSYVLAARDAALDLPLAGRAAYLSVDGNAAEILDPDTESPRPSTLADVAAITRVADALEEIAFLWQPVTARDAPAATAPLHELRVQLAATRKHIQMMSASTPDVAEGVVEIARVAAGGADELRGRPILSAFQCSVSPLSYESDALAAALVYARAGIPCGFVVMPIAGATAPITPDGALVQANAEALAGIVMLQTLVPGAPTFYGACGTAMDLRTGAATCSGPEDLFFQMAAAQLARHYHLPASVGTFATGSRRSNWQAGVENGMSGLLSCLSGAQMLSGAGLLEAAQVFSPVQMVLDCETFRLLCDLLALTGEGDAGVEATSSVNLMSEVGPGGHFLESEHTLEHMGDLWQPRCFDRRTRQEWNGAGRPGPADSAREVLRAILEGDSPSFLDRGQEAEIGSIIREREGRIPTGREDGSNYRGHGGESR